MHFFVSINYKWWFNLCASKNVCEFENTVMQLISFYLSTSVKVLMNKAVDLFYVFMTLERRKKNNDSKSYVMYRNFTFFNEFCFHASKDGA